MPRLAEREDTDHLRPFTHHGLDLTDRGNQADGDCPFCTAVKFTVQVDTGVWRCWVCSRTGNPLEFLRQLHAASMTATDQGWYAKMADDRRLVDPDTLRQWGACRSVVDGAWMLAGYSTRGELVQVYRRVQVQSEKDQSWSWRLLPTPGVWPEGKAHALHMARDLDPSLHDVVVTEGPWDGMALWEVVRHGKVKELSDCAIMAVPGCSVWQDVWTESCRGKAVTLLYDNDHPRDNSGTISMAGHDGMRRVAGKLAGVAKSVSYLCWGGGGYDASLADGYDVRDVLSKGVG